MAGMAGTVGPMAGMAGTVGPMAKGALAPVLQASMARVL